MKAIFVLSDIMVHVDLQIALVSESVSISKVHFLSYTYYLHVFFKHKVSQVLKYL